ncbi:MAG TPA: gluconokinase [Thermohalobaculum sp.]|nr:gluconokinase [Thermohalobaculum sp.]
MIVVTMGVCGTGKTSVGQIVASRMGWTFIEGDDLHPALSREKMASGTPLTDDDRWPWLDSIAEAMHVIHEAGGSAVVACSALRQVYRDRLRLSGAEIIFLHLTGDASLIRERMEARRDHFMPPGLLDSQLATLEAPRADEPVFEIDVAGSVEEIAGAVVRSLSGDPASD